MTPGAELERASPPFFGRPWSSTLPVIVMVNFLKALVIDFASHGNGQPHPGAVSRHPFMAVRVGQKVPELRPVGGSGGSAGRKSYALLAVWAPDSGIFVLFVVPKTRRFSTHQHPARSPGLGGFARFLLALGGHPATVGYVGKAEISPQGEAYYETHGEKRSEA